MSERADEPTPIIDAEVQPVAAPGRRWRWLAAAIVAIALAALAGGVYVAPWLGPLPDRFADLRAQIAALAAKLEGLDPMREQLQKLEARVAAIEGRLEAGPPPQIAAEQRQQIAGLKEQVADLGRQIAGRADMTEPLRKIESRLAALEQKAGTEGPGLALLAQRLAAVEQKLAERGAADPAAAARIQGFDQRLQAIERALADPATTGRLQAFDQRLEALERTLPDLAAANRVEALDKRLAAAEAATGALQKERTSAADSSARQAALVLALGRLRAAADAGNPFAAELVTVERLLDSPPPALAAMRVSAATGAPTVAQLQARFAPLAPGIVRAAATAPDPAWWEAALQRVRGLVTVRRTGEVAGDSADAIVARTEARLKANDLAAALAELGKLTGPAAQAAAAWRAEAERRRDLDRALADLDAAATAALADAGVPR